MATKVIPVALVPDLAGGLSYFEPAAINFGSNDRYNGAVLVFPNTSTRDKAGFEFRVPQDYMGAGKFIVEWATPATSGNADWEIDYTAVAAGETLDPSSDQEAVGAVEAAPGTARLRKDTEITITAGNLAAGDKVIGSLCRNGAGSDTIADALYGFGLYFSYSDV